MESKAYFFLLSCVTLFDALHAVELSTCTDNSDAACKARRALTEDASPADGNAVELLQMKSSAKANQNPEAKSTVVTARQMLDSVIRELDIAKKARAELHDIKDKSDADGGYNWKTVEAEVRKKLADEQSAKGVLNETTHLQEDDAPHNVDYWRVAARGKWCNNKNGAVKSKRGIAGENYTKDACQAACEKDRSCKYFSFNKADKGWCTTYSECGELTETPNGYHQTPMKHAITIKKDNQQEHVEHILSTLKTFANKPSENVFAGDWDYHFPSLKEAKQKAFQNAAEATKRQQEAQLQQQEDTQAQKEAEEEAKKDAEETAKKEAEEKAKKEAEEKAMKEAEELAKMFMEKANKEADEKAKKEAAEKAKKEAAEKAKEEAEEKAKKEAEKRAKKEAAEKAKKEAEEKAWQEVEEMRTREAEAKALKEEEERAKKEALEKASKFSEAHARMEAEEHARKEAEEKTKKDAEEKAKKAAEGKAKQEAAEKGVKEAEAEAKARMKADEKALKEAEESAKKMANEERKSEKKLDDSKFFELEEIQPEAIEASRKVVTTPHKEAKSAAKIAQREIEEMARKTDTENVKKEAKRQKKRQEFRLDHDGHAYTKRDFLDYYGDLEVWDKAPEAHMKHLKNRHDIVHDVFDEAEDANVHTHQERMPDASFYLLANGKWCSNKDGEKNKDGVAGPGYSLAECKAQCLKKASCAAFSFNTKGNWCATFLRCGTLTTQPNYNENNHSSDETATWSTYEKATVHDDRLKIAEAVKNSKSMNKGHARMQETSESSDDFELLGKHKWCDNRGIAVKDPAGVAGAGHTLASCKAACAASSTCKSISFNKLDGWCTTYLDCGTPTTNPNKQKQDTHNWYTFFKKDGKRSSMKEKKEGATTQACMTNEGAACVFPFAYKGTSYDRCTYVDGKGVAWCATNAADMGWLMGERPEGAFGACNAACQEAGMVDVNREAKEIQADEQDTEQFGVGKSSSAIANAEGGSKAFERFEFLKDLAKQALDGKKDFELLCSEANLTPTEYIAEYEEMRKLLHDEEKKLEIEEIAAKRETINQKAREAGEAERAKKASASRHEHAEPKMQDRKHQEIGAKSGRSSQKVPESGAAAPGKKAREPRSLQDQVRDQVNTEVASEHGSSPRLQDQRLHDQDVGSSGDPLDPDDPEPVELTKEVEAAGGSSCTTVDGDVCLFPFVYQGITYDKCTQSEGHGKPWCATKMDSPEWLQGKAGKHEWGYCSPTNCKE